MTPQDLYKYKMCNTFLLKVLSKSNIQDLFKSMDHYVFTECDTQISVSYKLLAYPVTAELFLKDGYDFTTCNTVRDMFCIILMF